MCLQNLFIMFFQIHCNECSAKLRTAVVMQLTIHHNQYIRKVCRKGFKKRNPTSVKCSNPLNPLRSETKTKAILGLHRFDDRGGR